MKTISSNKLTKLIVIIFTILITINFAQAASHYTEQSLAIAILNKAAANTDSSALRDMYNSMSNILENAPLSIPPSGSDFQKCDAGTLAYTAPGISNSIYICNLLQGQSSSIIAQTLIHESAHLAGYSDECDATRMEVSAMQLSGVGLAFRNGYMDRCGL